MTKTKKPDNRLLFAMYDVERAVHENAADLDIDELEKSMDRFADNIDTLAAETKALRESMADLGKLVSALSDVMYDAVEATAKGGV